MKIKIGKADWITNSDTRLDASYHLSEALETKRLLDNSPYEIATLQEVTSKIFSGPRFKRVYVDNPKNGIPFFTGSDTQKINHDNPRLVSKKYTTKLSELILERGWTLITRSGTIGNTAYTTNEFVGKAGSEDLIRVTPNNRIAKQGYIYAYLSSKHGYALLTQSTYGGVIQHIEPHHIADLPIPLLPEPQQQHIHNLIEKAALLREEANRLLREAKAFFDEKFDFEQDEMTSSININKIFKFNDRLDATYLRTINQVENIIHQSGIEYKKLKKLTSGIFMGPRSKRNYVANGFPFLNTSDMLLANPTNPTKFIGKSTNNLEEFFVKKDYILISRSGTIGNIACVGEAIKDYAITEDAIRVVVNDDEFDTNYVLGFLSSNFGKKYIQSTAFGSVILHINESYLGEMMIPILSENEVVIIKEKVKQYRQNIDDAITLENQAITELENTITSWQN